MFFSKTLYKSNTFYLYNFNSNTYNIDIEEVDTPPENTNNWIKIYQAPAYLFGPDSNNLTIMNGKSPILDGAHDKNIFPRKGFHASSVTSELKPLGCQHVWKTYIGLGMYDPYDYCDTCGVKK